MLDQTHSAYQEQLAVKLAELPDCPGVYLHKNARGEIIYVGKAVSLKNRVRQYFQSSRNQPPKVVAMVRNIADFDYVLTDTEAEALTLESNLIKAHRPYYNILLKDDKHFPYVRIDTRAAFPRVEIVHEVKNDGAKYFGPYLSKSAVKESIEAVRENFPLRTCKKDIQRAVARSERPCLNYYIGKCAAPCTGQVSLEEYRAIVDSVAAFLNGDTDAVISKLRLDMARAADEMAYERAAMLRDRIRAIETIGEKQKAIAANTDERDIFACARDGTDVVVFALLMRAGKIVGAENFIMIAPDESPEDVMNSFLKQFYSQGNAIPREILMRNYPSDAEAVAQWLDELRGAKVHLLVPQRGEKKKLVEMAYKNGCDQLAKKAASKRREWERTEGALRDLATALELDELPRRIEAFDISHTMGTDPVASMVVFEGGRPSSKLYRRFKIKTAQNDDYASMREVITRRFRRGIDERETGKTDGWAAFPDLLLIDGGKGQLSSALEALHAIGLYEGDGFQAVGLAERLEEIFLPGRSESVILERGSAALHLVQRVRDEAHRFAITYHRSLRQKTALFSVLDEISGVGPRRRKALFDAFVSMSAIQNASVEELAATKGMDRRSAQAVYDYFHLKERDKQSEKDAEHNDDLMP